MNVFTLFHKHKLPIPGGAYTLGLILVLLTLALRIFLLPGFQIPILVIFVPAILATSVLGGFRAGVFATAFSCVCADYVLIPPFFAVSLPSGNAAMDLASLAITGLVVAAVCAILRNAIEQSEAAKQELARALSVADQLAREQKETEKALRTQANLLMQSFDAIIVWRLDGNIEWWNAGAEKLYGFTAAEAVGQETHTLLSTTFPRSWAEVRQELVETGTWEGELRHRTRDGREVVVSARKQLVRDSNGIPRVLETNRDITEKKQAEAALRQSEERHRLLHETMRDAFVQCSMDGRILDCNEAFCDMLEYTEEELQSLRYQDLTPERWHGIDAAKVSGMVLTRGYSDVYEKEYLRKDGTAIPVELRVMLSRDGQGQPETMWAIVRDLSERKRYEEHLRSMRDQLAHVGRLSELAQVSAGIAHELNQPLAAMMNYSNVAKRLIASRDVDHLERAHDAIAKATDQAERAGLIIRRMRGFIEKRESNRALESVNAIVEEAVAVGLLGTQGDGIITKLDLAEALPPVYADRLQLQQVVVNLVRNAVEAMADAPHRELSLVTEINERNEVVISVRDTGPGLSKDQADRVFMPFFTTKPGGMGIGLVIGQSIAEAHGGRITVASTPGQGAEFRLYLPSAEAGATELQSSWG